MLKSLITRFNQLSVWRRSVQVWGHELKAPTFDRLLALWLHRASMMGVEDQTILRRLVRPGMRIADVGANQGLYALLMADLTGPDGEILCFEPQPELNAVLRLNIGNNNAGNIRIFDQAVGAEPGTSVLQESCFNSGDNRVGEWGGGRTFEIEVAPLDTILAENRRLEFMKIDVQGYELPAFQGMAEVMAASPELVIYLEYWPSALKAQSGSATAILELLEERGFLLSEFVDGEPLALRPGAAGHEDLQRKIKGAQFVNLLATRRPASDVWSVEH